MKFVFTACAMLLFMVGCSSPQYETQYNFTPPTERSGLMCLNHCQTTATQCKTQCSTKLAQCSAKAAQQAQQELPLRLAKYEGELTAWQRYSADYERDLRFYEMELQHRALLGGIHHKHGLHHGGTGLSLGMTFGDRIGSPPAPPKKPTLASVAEEIKAETCQTDCGCDSNYRQCYGSCGGTVKPVQICKEGCTS